MIQMEVEVVEEFETPALHNKGNGRKEFRMKYLSDLVLFYRNPEFPQSIF